MCLMVTVGENVEAVSELLVRVVKNLNTVSLT